MLDFHFDPNLKSFTRFIYTLSYNFPSRKKARDREVESRISEESEEPVVPPAEKLPGLLPPDPGLWEHITYTRTHLHPLPSSQEQVKELAR